MDNFNDSNETDIETVTPDAAIAKFADGTYSVIKFELEENPITLENRLVVYGSEISSEDIRNIDVPSIRELDEHSILFVKIHYEFQFDEDSGVMEMQLSQEVTLSDIETDELVTSQEIIENTPQDLIPIYLDVLKSL